MSKWIFPLVFALAGTQLGAHAQTVPPDAGLLQQRPPTPTPAPAVSPKIVVSPAAQTTPDELVEGSLEVRAFRFSGDLGDVPEARLQQMLAGDAGKVVTLQALHRVADKLERYLQTERQLIVAKAWVPLQDVQQGVVEIRILAGIAGSLQTDARFPAGAARDGALATARGVIPPGAPLLRERLEEAVYRVSDFLGMPVRAVLLPAAALGQYDVAFEVDQGQRVSASAAIDNTGNRYTSQWHDSLSARVANLSGRADQLAVHVQALTPNQRNLYLNYQLPLAQGYRIGATVQASHYRLCCAFAPLDASGSTRLFSVDLARALVRTRRLNLSASAELLQRRLSNHQLGLTTSAHTVSELTIGTRADAVANDVLYAGWLNLTFGHVDVRANGADALTDPASARLDGRFAKLGFGYTRSEPIDSRSDGVVKLSGQAASKNLDSSETFLLGGMGAVRAYPAGETAGDQSVTLQLEYHRRLGERLRAFGFYDHGWIELHRNLWPGYTGENRFRLQGTGAGVVWNPAPRYELSLIGAVKLGHNPLANPQTGNDSDGRASRYRLWAFANVRF